MKLKIGLISLALLISGCSTVQKKQPEQQNLPISWHKHVQDIKSIEKWQANAQIAITIGKETQRAKMAWNQAKQKYTISFSGPFGQSGPELTGNKSSATLNIPKEQSLKGRSASQLLQQRLGWHLPVENAKYWMLGIPSPDSESNVLLKNEKLAQLTQDGWTIRYPKYKQINQSSLPSKITISRDDFRLIVVVYKWNTDQQIALKQTSN